MSLAETQQRLVHLAQDIILLELRQRQPRVVLGVYAADRNLRSGNCTIVHLAFQSARGRVTNGIRLRPRAHSPRSASGCPRRSPCAAGRLSSTCVGHPRLSVLRCLLRPRRIVSRRASRDASPAEGNYSFFSIHLSHYFLYLFLYILFFFFFI